MRNDFLEHSHKGSTWKNHKYIRKEGDKYIYKESYTDDSGNVWEKYVNPDTGETIRKNTGFKYNPKRYTTQDFGNDIKDDYGPSHYEMYEKEGQSIIASLFKKDEKYMAKK